MVPVRTYVLSQHQLIQEREARGVLLVRPGITGLAQVQGVDMSAPERLAEIDAIMLEKLTVTAYFKYLLQTLVGKGRGDRVL